MPAQPARNDCCRSCLRGSLRGLNYLLAIVGVLMTAYALFMWVQWEEAKKPDTPTPPAALEALSHFPQRAFGMKNAAASIIQDPLDGMVMDERLMDPETTTQVFADEPEKYQEMGTGDDPTPAGGKTVYPWFIYIFGGAGVFVFITASIGIISADCAACGVTCFLGLYHALMVLMLLLQIAVVCFYFFDKSWEHDLPADSTGEYAKLRDIIMKHIPACKIAGLAALGLQLLSLMVSCSLYYAEGRPASQPRLDQRSLDPRHPYHQPDYETGSQVSLGMRGGGVPGPSNGGRFSDREIAARYTRPKGQGSAGRPSNHSPPAGPGPSRLAIANEQAAATSGYDEEVAAAGPGDDEIAAGSSDAKGGNCAIM